MSLIDFIKLATPKVAKKNITVYKGVKKITQKNGSLKYKAMYYSKFTYTGNIQVANNFKISKASGTIGNSYYFQVSAGFHSCKRKGTARDHCNSSSKMEVVKEFIIPKGAEYYENGNEYVSNKIKMVK